MKKNIIIVALSILLVLSVGFGFVQRTEANQQRQLAELNAQLALESKKEAQMQRQLAIESQMIAVRQLQLAKEECAKKK